MSYGPVLDTLMSMKIGELANTAGVTTKTIRYYESIGVLDEPARSESGYRSYGPAAIERLDFVKQAQSSGLALAEIRSILEIKDQGGQTCEHTTSLLRWHLDELDAKIVELQTARVELQAMYKRAGALDPAECTDANRCQIITAE
jgi:MerR family copper efflux transcriptional regulator|tara:strand:+ start:196 stop:630 length:435 start_codon:yes stop_codon:yes gene_type:complete